jgi:type I restriction enzyme S subunit
MGNEHPGWAKCKIGDLGKVVTGRTPSSSKPECFGNKFPFITPTDMDERKTIHETQRYLSDSGFALLRSNALPSKSVTVSCIGWQMGKSALTGQTSFTNQQLNTIVPDRSIVEPDYLYYALRTRREELKRLGSIGTRTPILNKSAFCALEVLIPPPKTQKTIASILSAYDDLIENNTRRIKIMEEMARLIYREWFVNFRFPGHEKVKMVKSGVGLFPQGWCVERLERNLSVLETGNRPKGGIASFREGVPSIGAESISRVGRFDYAKTKYVPVEYFEKMNQGILQDRDVLVYKDGGQPGNFHPHVSLVGDGFPFSKMVINSHVYRLRTADRITQDYLYYHLSSDESLKWMHLHGTGSAIPGLARQDLLQLPLIVPPRTLVQGFDNFARPLTSLILITARQTQNLRVTREYLLPKLVSGQVSVKQFETEAVAQGV